MVSCALFILGPLWVHILGHACSGEELSREEVLSWVRVRVLEGLRLEEPPLTPVQAPDRDPAPQRAPRTTWVKQQSSPTQETSEIILFPNSGEKYAVFLTRITLLKLLTSYLCNCTRQNSLISEHGIVSNNRD